ncbi:MAG: caspase family protein [Rubrivivax sp.]
MSLLAQEDGRWVAWTPSGFFDASAGADRIVGWALARGASQAMDFYSLARFRPAVQPAGASSTRCWPPATSARRWRNWPRAPKPNAQRCSARPSARPRQRARPSATRRARRACPHRRATGSRAPRRRQALRAKQPRPPSWRAAGGAARQAAIAQARAQAERDAAAQAAARAEAEARAAAERQRQEREAALAAERERQRLEAERLAAEQQARERERIAQEAAREGEERQRAEAARRALAELRAAEFRRRAGRRWKSQKAAGNVVTLPFALHSPTAAGDVDATRSRWPGGRRCRAKWCCRDHSTARCRATRASSCRWPTASIRCRWRSSPTATGTRSRWLSSSSASCRRHRPAAGRSCCVLAIGVAEYARPEYRLGLAAKDAADFAAAMKRQEGRQYRRVVVKTLTNAEATKAAVLREFDWLRTSVTPGDTAMLFIAGHGVNDAQGQYFFMPYDAQHERLLSTGVPQAAIVSTLAQIRGRTLMFIDTCFAGNALGALHKAPKKTERLINDLSASENGVVVFASSTGQEESLEKESWGNGAFTKALLEGLSGRADFMRAGRITYAALNLFVSEEVSRLTDGRQRPVFISPRGVPDFALARL